MLRLPRRVVKTFAWVRQPGPFCDLDPMLCYMISGNRGRNSSDPRRKMKFHSLSLSLNCLLLALVLAGCGPKTYDDAVPTRNSIALEIGQIVYGETRRSEFEMTVRIGRTVHREVRFRDSVGY